MAQSWESIVCTLSPRSANLSQLDKGTGLPWALLRSSGRKGSYLRERQTLDNPHSRGREGQPQQTESCGAERLGSRDLGALGGDSSHSDTEVAVTWTEASLFLRAGVLAW